MTSSADDIIVACVRGDRPLVAQMLKQDPALATAANMFGVTPLHAAHYCGHHEIADLLRTFAPAMDAYLAAELDDVGELRQLLALEPTLARSFNSRGSTALHGAVYWGGVGAAEFLIASGADVNAPTRDAFLQIAPLGSAVAAPNIPSPSDDENVVLRLVDLLLDAGASVNARRRDGMTALHAAAYRGHLRVIDRLLERGADITLRAYENVGPHSNQSPRDTALSQSQAAAAERLRRAEAERAG
jgi:uncharacterized protein